MFPIQLGCELLASQGHLLFPPLLFLEGRELQSGGYNSSLLSFDLPVGSAGGRPCLGRLPMR